MSEFFLLWSALLLVLLMVAAAPLPDRMRAVGIVGFAITVWLLWALYGVELLADLKWPLDKSLPNPSTQAGDAAGAAETATARLGQVGDLFGGVNALFAALAFAGVGIAAFQQWKSTRIAFKQSIESTFFSAVELHHRLVDGLRFDRVRIFPAEQDFDNGLFVQVGLAPRSKPDPVSGREVFHEVMRAISYGGTRADAYPMLVSNYGKLQKSHNYVLGHYFRNLYQILKLIDTDEALDDPGRQKYASFLRAQLSSDELALLMVNCADALVDGGEFRALVIRYRLLEHIPLRRSGSEYLYDGGIAGRVVLANEESIQQYLREAPILNTPRVHRGAFGSNPAFVSTELPPTGTH